MVMHSLKESIANSKLGGLIIRGKLYYAYSLYKEAAKVADIHTQGKVKHHERNILIRDMLRMRKQYRYNFNEYFLYSFQNKTLQDRLTFLPDAQRYETLSELNREEYKLIFCDKAKTYQHFSHFFGRELLLVTTEDVNAEKKFQQFASEHTRFIVKPIDSSMGKGIRIIDQANDQKSIEDLYHWLIDMYADKTRFPSYIGQHRTTA